MNNEKGFTLLDVILSAVIVVASFAALYIAIVYSQKTLVRNSHDRVATLIASGELEWQYYMFNALKNFDEFNWMPVVIDTYPNGHQLIGKMLFSKPNIQSDNALGQLMYHQPIIITVQWTEPGDRRLRSVALREDFAISADIAQ
ncbi:MAG TPA: hypothetical protein PLE74_00250 [Candidatus Cloacimonadota bacterium]|nr:hypothetical protein [Candidatus Cloacimonadota bacterium]HPT70690.1 hypothetical protein [Candidatus Cloacimonadota bacterium]